MVARRVTIVALVWTVLGCTSAGAGAPSSVSQASASATADAMAEDAGGVTAEDAADACAPIDASTFSFRASCTYPLPSDAGAASACDEWFQGGADDWGAFEEGCIPKNGTLSAQPCPSSGRTGQCRYAATCTSQLSTTVYGGGPSVSAIEEICEASPGAAWTAM